jgi:AraC-like DNA-binding protein
MPIYFLLGPMAYFFIRSITRNSAKLSQTDLLHFAPFIIVLVGILPYLFSNFQDKLILVHRVMLGDLDIFSNHTNIFITNGWSVVVRNFILFGYIVAAIVLYIKEDKNLKKNLNASGFHHNLVRFYLRVFLLIIFIFSAFALLFSFRMLHFQGHVFNFYLANGSSFFYIRAYLLLVLNIILFFIPEMLYGIPLQKSSTGSTFHYFKSSGFQVLNESKESILNSEKYLFFNEDYIRQIDESILTYLSSKPYLNPVFTQTILSEATNIPGHHLAFYFNRVLNRKFTDWRNQLRVQYAKELIEKENSDPLTVKTICEECGFSNQTTFIKFFKQELDMTPIEYIRSLKVR